MSDFATTLTPIIVLILLGYGLKRARFMSDEVWSGMEKLTYFVLFPVLLVRTLGKQTLAGAPWPSMLLLITVALGFTFLGFQIYEYAEAYNHLGLTLNSGIYGSTFFMLTGFHGAHVTIGGIMLSIMLLRVFKGHFKPDDHFGFEAASWYWHFVDVVWVGLFLFVYIL